MRKRAVLIFGLMSAICLGFYFANLKRPVPAENTVGPQPVAVDDAGPTSPTPPAPSDGSSNAAGGSTTQPVSREFDLTVNPYAAALRQPGRSKSSWNENFLAGFREAASGEAIRFELMDGRFASGIIRITQHRDNELFYLSGELTEPESGRFFFLKPPAGGKAGKAVGVIEFPASQTAYRLEPTGPNGEPELWERRLDEVICINLPLNPEAVAQTNDTAEMPPLRPELVPEFTPSYNSSIVSLQSYPGSSAVLLLDFFGGYTTTWGGVTYSRPNVSNAQIKDLWKRVAEDFLPFNINVTTDRQVYEAAPAISRQRCVFTPSSTAVGSGAAGVAYIGSWNWGNDTVCWSIYTSDKNGAEVGAHEPGHTLGLGHQGTSTQEYFSGHGSGVTGWAPIMGTGYTRPVTTWAKGEYQNANNTEDELSVIVSQNNNVDYRPDDTGGVLATARHLEVYPDFAAMAEGVIERAGDTDAFEFTTSGGRAYLTARPAGDWANLAVMATITDAAGNVIASNNPQSTLGATISTNLSEGTYAFRVTGAGRNNPLNNGFTAYGSLGYYSVVGSVAGARLPTRLSVFERVPSGTVVGVVPSRMADTNDPVVCTIVSGNAGETFAIDHEGVVTVADSTLLDYQRLATNTMIAVQFELFVNIANLNDPTQTEFDRRVVIAVLDSAVHQPMALTGWNAGVLAPYDATTNVPKATAFDLLNNYCFYQAGLSGNPQVNTGGGGKGLPLDGRILSRFDGSVFQLGPYGGTNALMLGNSYPRFGTLALTQPRAYNSLAMLAASANGGGNGTLVINFVDGSRSPVFALRAQDWYNITTNVAIEGFGRLRLGQSGLLTEDAGADNPNLYQTTINLAALGLNQAIASITFTNPAGSASVSSGIFAVSGVAMSPVVNLTQQPKSVTNNLPTQDVTFTAIAMGAPPLSWQWYFSANGSPGTFVPLTGLTGSNLVLSAEVQATNVGSYQVVVTNSFSAATSAVATLTLHRSPVITRQPSPTSLFLFTGRLASFSVAANAALPTTYYYLRDGSPVAAGASSNYSIANLQLSHSGHYTILVSNAFGVATSSVVSLTVVASPTNYPYAQSVLAGAPQGYWRLNESGGNVAHDYVNGRNGTYNSVTLNQAGYNPLDPDRSARFGPGNNSYVGGIPLDFATSGSASFSIEAWVRGNAQTTDAGIVTKGTGAGGEQFSLDTGAGGRAFRFFVRDGTGIARLANGTIAPNGNWQHVVGVCSQPSGLVILYVNGVSNASGTINPGSRVLASTNAVTIGSRQSGTGAFDFQFNGWIDEVAIYGYALTAAQVQARYAVRTNVPPEFTANPFAPPPANAGRAYAGTIAASATDPNGDALTFSKLSGPAWLSLAGNGTLSGTPLASDAGNNSFVVRASDPAGLSASATMNLTVIAPIYVAVSAQGPDVWLTWTGGVPPYQVQVTTNVASPEWTGLGGPVAGNSLLLPVTNRAAFYRIVGH
jgi:hypothetical protein